MSIIYGLTKTLGGSQKDLFSLLKVIHPIGSVCTCKNGQTDLKGIVISPENPLPSGYTMLECIESTGTQYINTGVTGTGDTSIEMECATMSTSAAAGIFYGAAQEYNNRAFECYTGDGNLEFNYGSSYQFTDTTVANQKITIKHNKNNVIIEKNGEVSSQIQFSYSSFTTPSTICLFAISRPSGVLKGSVKIYSCKIYSGDTLTRNFIPCIQDSSGQIGMYDLITNSFYGNNGTGDFKYQEITPKTLFEIPFSGTWTITCTKGTGSVSQDVVISNAGELIEIELNLNPEWYNILKIQSVGETLSVDGYEWIIVNKTSTTATLGLHYWYTDTIFGSNSTYAGSTIAALAKNFEDNTLSTETKQFLNNVTINGVTAKVFIPSYELFNGGFSYYNSDSRRIFKNISGTAKPYWTSSPNGSSVIWGVRADGLVYSLFGSPSSSNGFRPHMEVNLTL